MLLTLAVLTSTAAAATAAKSLQTWPTLYNPIDSSPPGSSIHGIFQARVLEWVAIAFSDLCSQSINGTSLAVRGVLQTEQVIGRKEETTVKGPFYC